MKTFNAKHGTCRFNIINVKGGQFADIELGTADNPTIKIERVAFTGKIRLVRFGRARWTVVDKKTTVARADGRPNYYRPLYRDYAIDATVESFLKSNGV